MIYVSFVDLFATSVTTLSGVYGYKIGYAYSTICFFIGVFIIGVIDKLVPEHNNPHEIRDVTHKSTDSATNFDINDTSKKNKLMRTGLVTALVLAIHNFPEGMVTFLSGLHDINIAIPVAIAIAIHNIPEGISVSVPIYYATGNRKKAFSLSLLSGIAEPIGALVGYLLLLPFLNDTVFGAIFALIAGIMVFISLDELLPAAEAYGKHHLAIYGLIAGMAVMALSLTLLK
ncbi:Zinc transporter ZupT [bioreactor metagenome]|uniref:Zinc transporter ZupT n=1 Tax=bioreactor metagenome TaxID=1076179 RepID=A0A645EHT2_9ZZZZ